MKVLFFIFVALLLTSCTVEPEPLQYGSEPCHTCKMTLMDKKFGAELVTKKGKIYKFDDINCMLTFYNSGEVEPGEFAYKLVVDFTQPGSLVDAADAFYLKSAAIKTPMASQVAAFAHKADLDARNKQLHGIYLVWGELVTQFKQ